MPNEVEGWDVVREEDGVALSNHMRREDALAAAKIRADEDYPTHQDGEPVTVEREQVHPIDDTRQGMKPAFLWLGALLVAVTILIIVLALTGALTGFGS